MANRARESVARQALRPYCKSCLVVLDPRDRDPELRRFRQCQGCGQLYHASHRDDRDPCLKCERAEYKPVKVGRPAPLVLRPSRHFKPFRPHFVDLDRRERKARGKTQKRREGDEAVVGGRFNPNELVDGTVKILFACALRCALVWAVAWLIPSIYTISFLERVEWELLAGLAHGLLKPWEPSAYLSLAAGCILMLPFLPELFGHNGLYHRRGFWQRVLAMLPPLALITYSLFQGNLDEIIHWQWWSERRIWFVSLGAALLGGLILTRMLKRWLALHDEYHRLVKKTFRCLQVSWRISFALGLAAGLGFLVHEALPASLRVGASEPNLEDLVRPLLGGAAITFETLAITGGVLLGVLLMFPRRPRKEDSRVLGILRLLAILAIAGAILWCGQGAVDARAYWSIGGIALASAIATMPFYRVAC